MFKSKTQKLKLNNILPETDKLSVNAPRGDRTLDLSVAYVAAYKHYALTN